MGVGVEPVVGVVTTTLSAVGVVLTSDWSGLGVSSAVITLAARAKPAVARPTLLRALTRTSSAGTTPYSSTGAR